ncbi:GtrA family protein [bacterium]|nr:GtrA family protein [bacterium]
MGKRDFVYIFIISELIFVCLAFIYLNLEKATLESKFLFNFFSFLRKIKIFFVLPVAIPFFAYVGVFVGFLFSKKIKSFFEFVKFFLVGVLNTVLDLGILNFLVLVSGFTSGFYYSLFKSISFLIAASNSYFWNKVWVFESKEKNVKKESAKFLLISIGGLIINVGIASLIVVFGKNFLNVSSRILGNFGAIGAVLGSMFWNFFGYKFFVFKKSLKNE